MRSTSGPLVVAVLGVALVGCGGNAASESTHQPVYQYTCCQSADVERSWQAGQDFTLHWMTQVAQATNTESSRYVNLAAQLAGPYQDVTSLKSAGTAARTLAAPSIRADTWQREQPVSSIPLPPDLPPGFYNLAFKVGWADGSSAGGASIIQVGASSQSAFTQRPLQLPLLASNAACPTSSMTNLEEPLAPNYGFGSGPAYLSGQTDWYSDGQVAILMIDSGYPGPVLMRASQLGGGGMSTITLAADDLSPTAAAGVAAKEQQHSVEVVSAAPAAGGGLLLAPAASSAVWRAWFGRLSTSRSGCFAIQVDGDTFSEVIVFSVKGGPPPPS
jgi:methionine-rich copper-binding protein CopC